MQTIFFFLALSVIHIGFKFIIPQLSFTDLTILLFLSKRMCICSLGWAKKGDPINAKPF